MRPSLLIILLLAFSPVVAWCNTNPTYTQVGHSIYVGPDQRVGELTCFACSVHIRGQVAGDVTTFGGSVTVEDQGQVAGDITTFGGNVRLDRTVKVAGDVTVFGGEIRHPPEAQVAGDVTTFGGRGWLLPMLLAPFLFVGILVGFVIWLVQRIRRPAVVPA